MHKKLKIIFLISAILALAFAVPYEITERAVYRSTFRLLSVLFVLIFFTSFLIIIWGGQEKD